MAVSKFIYGNHYGGLCVPDYEICVTAIRRVFLPVFRKVENNEEIFAMLKRTITMAALVLLGSSSAFAADDGSMKGVWSRGDGNARVRIDNCGAALCATNLWIKSGTPSEKVGDTLIMNLKPSGEGKYEGKAEDPQRGLTYNLQVNVSGASMTTRGCVLAKIVCKSVNWSRAQ